MIEFFAALIAFLAAHALPRALGWRDALVERLGRRAYVIGYSLLSLGLLIWLISAALRADRVVILYPSVGAAHFLFLLMAPAIWLFLSGARRPNPLSIAFREGAVDPADPGALALTRHPILWGFFLWGLGHGIMNFEVALGILFFGSSLFALIGMRLMDRRARRTLGASEWARLAARSSGSLGARLKRLGGGAMAIELLASAAIYALLLWSHPLLFGADPLNWIG